MKIYFRILKFAKPYKLFILISLVTSILYVVTNGLSLWIIGSLLSSVMSDGIIIDNSVTALSFTDKINQFLFSYVNINDKVELLKFLSYSLIVCFKL